MPALKSCLSRRLTARETVTVVLAVVVLGAIGYAGYRWIAARRLEEQVTAAFPAFRAEAREERTQMVRAIEAYKAHFGAYPPDHVVSRQPLVVDPVANPLYYELVGVIYNPANKKYQVEGVQPADAAYVKAFLHCDGFRNCAETPGKLTRFLDRNAAPPYDIHDDPDVVAPGFNIPFGALSAEVAREFEPSSWRYVVSAPTHNPGRFDLWVELGTRNRKVVVGNWPSVE